MGGFKDNVDLKGKTIRVTGVVGFIGSDLAKRLLETIDGAKVIGIDNLNDYYEVKIKEACLKELYHFPAFLFVKGNLAEKAAINNIFKTYKPSVVVNLAAQTCVRYSIINPDIYRIKARKRVAEEHTWGKICRTYEDAFLGWRN